MRNSRIATPSSHPRGQASARTHPLAARARQASQEAGLEKIAIVGGVAANAELRNALPGAVAAPLELCTDNAAMIASAARWVEPLQPPDYLDLDVYASVA